MNGFMYPSGDGNKIYYLGAGTSFNVSSIDGYKNFTASNFLVGTESGYYKYTNKSVGYVRAYSCSPTVYYNASTGVVTISGTTAGADFGANQESHYISVTPKVYLVTKPLKIETL